MTEQTKPVTTRLDNAVYERGLVASRARAQEVIKAGHVRVNGGFITKPASKVTNEDRIELSDEALTHVSRAALKLIHALDYFDLSPAGVTALDLGASTGGFTEVLLEQGANHVYAVDVGHDQLHEKLRSDARVTSLEGRDARSLDEGEFEVPPNVLTIDVSFISLKKALAHPLTLAASKAWLIALIKPQFEVGPKGLNKKGVVKSKELSEGAVMNIIAWLNEQSGWSVIGTTPSPIKGHAGNQEILIAAQRL
jgi:23S rRNA (cytidine1920-2'-O)/16S rRNA (cytidine1409-2'-O)-methyltransferase